MSLDLFVSPWVGGSIVKERGLFQGRPMDISRDVSRNKRYEYHIDIGEKTRYVDMNNSLFLSHV